MSLLGASGVLMDWNGVEMMEYADGMQKFLAGTQKCVVEIQSVYMLSTLAYVTLLRNNLTDSTLLNVFSDK